MKKTVLTIVSFIFMVGFVFGVTEEQKLSFKNYVEENIDGNDFHNSLVRASSAKEITIIADWAIENPIEFNNFLSTVRGNHYIWAVRKSVNMGFDAGSLQDVVINDWESTLKKAKEDFDFYKQLKENEFKVGGLFMGNNKLSQLAAQWGDLQAFEALPIDEVAKNFGLYLKSIKASKLSPKNLYDKLSQVFLDYSKYKEDVTDVKLNWESFIEYKNDAFMAYYAEKKLNALNSK